MEGGGEGVKELVQVLGQMSEGATVGIVGYEGTGKMLVQRVQRAESAEEVFGEGHAP